MYDFPAMYYLFTQYTNTIYNVCMMVFEIIRLQIYLKKYLFVISFVNREYHHTANNYLRDTGTFKIFKDVQQICFPYVMLFLLICSGFVFCMYVIFILYFSAFHVTLHLLSNLFLNQIII